MPDLAGEKIAYFGFTGMIEPGNATRLAAAMNHATNEGFDGVVLAFSSNGGYVADGIFLYNHFSALPLKLTIYNTGTVASIAAAVFASGAERYCSRHAMFMIHPTSFSSLENMTSERLQANLNAALADDARTESILRERTALPEAILTARRFQDVYIAPDKALEYGLVHGIREFSLPSGNQIIQI